MTMLAPSNLLTERHKQAVTEKTTKFGWKISNPLPEREPSSICHYSLARLLRGRLNRHTIKLISKYSRNLLGTISTISEASMNKTLKGSPGQTRKGISTKSRELNKKISEF